MVFICPSQYNSENSSKYEEHFNTFPYNLDHFQKWSIEAIESEKHLLVTAHTGSGKSNPFEYAIQKYCINENKKIIYTSPIKSLSNQKFHELMKKYPSVSFGILTGDIKFNPEAQCLIMTTEILRNTLFQLENIENIEKNLSNTQENDESTTTLKEKLISTLQFNMDIENELACVIFDEVHYINDEDRGKVWEETIMKLPQHVQIIMLSATIDRSEQFAGWVETIKNREVWLASTNIRVVPLTHYSYQVYPQSLLKTIKEKDKSGGNIERIMKKQNNTLHKIRENNGVFYDDTIISLQKVQSFLSKNRLSHIKKHFIFNNLSSFLKENTMLPAICFTFSRKNVELYASEIEHCLFDPEKYPEEAKYPSNIEKECKKILMKLPNYKEYTALPEYTNIIKLMKKGVGIHHSGVLPIFREMTELMFEKGYIKLLFATETFAVGINMPTKTVVFTSLTKYSNSGFRYLLPHEYTQMAGRAGRRGLDTIGNVIHLNGMFKLPLLSEYKQILCGKPQTLLSKFKCNYQLVLKLLSLNTQNPQLEKFTENSMSYNELQKELKQTQKEYEDMKVSLQEKENGLKYLSTSTEQMDLYTNLIFKLEYSKDKKRKNIEREIQKLESSSSKSFKSDYQKYLEYNGLKDQISCLEKELENYNNFYQEKIDIIIEILKEYGFIQSNENTENTEDTENTENTRDNNMEILTEKGVIASNIQEVNGLVFSELFNDNSINDVDITFKELAMLFSCYNGVRVQEQYKMHTYTGNNYIFKTLLKGLEGYNTKYSNIELRMTPEIYNQDDYTINYDMCEAVEMWCDADDEESCKKIIGSLYEREIFLGEFIKSILKINNISMELQKICEITENYELLTKLIEIREKTMKYVVTNQSLYV